MKIGKRTEKIKGLKTNPSKNHSQKNLLIIGVAVVTALLIIWVYSMGQKAEETVDVAMWSEPIYKNEVIGEEQLQKYPMLKAEFEKYAVENKDGSKSRRIVRWDEREQLIGSFAAYPLQANTLVMISDIVTSRISNSDTVLYSYPGKNIVPLDLADQNIDSFKKFLQPGDRVNVTALYSERARVEKDDSGISSDNEVETLREEVVFKDIIVADMLNSDGNSVLDLYTEYQESSTWEQAQKEADPDWEKTMEPKTLLLALTPEEESLYYQYKSKSGVKFSMSLPQRSEKYNNINKDTSNLKEDNNTESTENVDNNNTEQ